MDNRPHPPRLDFSGVVPSGILQTIVIDIVFPYMLYQLLVSHISLWIAFALAAIIPLANIIRTRLALQTLDLLGIITLYAIIWIFINTMVQSSVALLPVLLTYILPIGILGLLTLLTRLFTRPLFFYVDRYFRTLAAEQPTLNYDYWQTKESYRQAIYRLNLVWGCGQIGLAIICLLLFLLLSVGLFTPCVLVTLCIFYILLAMWSIQYIERHAQIGNETSTNETHTSSSLSSRQDF